MTKTLIGSGKTLEDIKIGLDAVVLNEHKYWLREENGRLYAKAKVIQESGEYRIYLTGEAEEGITRERYE
jgi:hypothetical protein